MPLSADKTTDNAKNSPISGYLVLPTFAVASYQLFTQAAPKYVAAPMLPFYSFIPAILVLILIERYLTYTPRTLRIWSVLVGVLMLGCLLSAVDCPAALQIAGQIVGGVGRAAAVLLLGMYLCTISLPAAMLTLTAGFTLTNLCSLLGGYPFQPDSVAWTVVLALVLCLSLGWGLDRSLGGNVEPPAKVRDPRGFSATIDSIPLSGHVSVLATLVLMNLVIEICFRPIGVRGLSVGMWAGIHVLFLVVVVVWLFVMKREDCERLLPLFFVPAVLGPIISVLLLQFAQDYAASMILDLRRSSFLLVWMLAVIVVKKTGLPAVPVFGLFHLLGLHIPRLVLELVSPLMTGVNPESAKLAAMIAAIIMVVVIAVLIAVAVIYGMGRRSEPAGTGTAPEEADAAAKPDAAPPEEEPKRHPGNVIKAFSQEYALTERETEVVRYIARGFSFAEIGKRLFISPETVRSHARKAYMKTGAANKQEMLALLEAFSDRIR